jgi:putative ABC transport system substrate-binding protein
VVFAIGDDPVSLGLVNSFNNPGGHITGVTFVNVALVEKRLGILHELVPKDGTIALLANPANPSHASQLDQVRAAAQTLGRRIEVIVLRNAAELDQAFANIVERRIAGFFYSTDPFFNNHRHRLTAFAEKNRLPVVYSGREYIEAGGLMAYGSSIPEAQRLAGVYVGRILKGEKPANLPVVQPTKFELIINMKAARTLGLAMPDRLLALADEVIE